MRNGALAILLLLAACGGTVGGWQNPGGDRDSLARDDRECRAVAERVLARDRSIDQDIAATRSADWQRAGTAEPQTAQMQHHATAGAAVQFDACMQAKGYIRR